MRRAAGAFVRRWRIELLVIMAALAGAFIGLAAGAVLHRLTGTSLGLPVPHNSSLDFKRNVS